MLSFLLDYYAYVSMKVNPMSWLFGDDVYQAKSVIIVAVTVELFAIATGKKSKIIKKKWCWKNPKASN